MQHANALDSEMLYFVELLRCVTAGSENEIGGEKAGSPQLAERFPNFNAVGHHDELESSRFGAHRRCWECEIRMCGNH